MMDARVLCLVLARPIFVQSNLDFEKSKEQKRINSFEDEIIEVTLVPEYRRKR